MGALDDMIMFIGKMLWKLLEFIGNVIYYTVLFTLSFALLLTTLVTPWRLRALMNKDFKDHPSDDLEDELLPKSFEVFAGNMMSLITVGEYTIHTLP